jgi:hypothetical protein
MDSVETEGNVGRSNSVDGDINHLTADPGQAARTEGTATPTSTPSAPLQQLPPFSTLGIRFSKIGFIIDLLGGRDALAGKTTTVVNDDHLKPFTSESGLSLCDQLALVAVDAATDGNFEVAEAN